MKRLKYIFGLFSLSFVLLSVSNCGSSKDSKAITLELNPPFVIADAFSQDWVAGVQSGGSGTNIQITFKEIEEGVKLDQIYFRKKIVAATSRPDNPKICLGYIKNDVVRDIIMDVDPVKESQNTPPVPFPFELEANQAVISYSVAGSAKYYMLTGITEKPKIAYPATKPKGN